MIGIGGLVPDYKHFKVSDGVTFFIPLSPSLIRKWIRKKKRQNRFDGTWFSVGIFIIWFKRGIKK